MRTHGALWRCFRRASAPRALSPTRRRASALTSSSAPGSQPPGVAAVEGVGCALSYTGCSFPQAASASSVSAQSAMQSSFFITHLPVFKTPGGAFCYHMGLQKQPVETVQVVRKTKRAPVKWPAPLLCAYLLWMYLSMLSAPFLPAPMARMTVAAPVTASPPA